MTNCAQKYRSNTVDIAVVGAGPAGLITALCAAVAGFRIAIIGPRASQNDSRTAALFQPSINLLKRLHIWPQVSDDAAPLAKMRLVDARHAILRAPEVTFDAHEIGFDAFGYNIPNASLTRALDNRVERCCTRIVTRAVTDFSIADDAITLTTDEGQSLSCRLAVAADGRRSALRDAAGITTSTWTYPQTAVVTTFKHSRPHDNISTEFHRSAGPLTVVPAAGHDAAHYSSLVWVEAPSRAKELAALGDADFASTLMQKLGGLLGSISDIAPRQSFPLSGQSADRLAANRVALIGEAAHVIPPIGAQGLNLSFRDAASLAEVAAKAYTTGVDIGAPATLNAYSDARRGDVDSRIWGVGLLNRSLLSPHLPVHLMRGLSLAALKVSRSLRAVAMRQGMAMDQQLPELMQPLACDTNDTLTTTVVPTSP